MNNRSAGAIRSPGTNLQLRNDKSSPYNAGAVGVAMNAVMNPNLVKKETTLVELGFTPEPKVEAPVEPTKEEIVQQLVALGHVFPDPNFVFIKESRSATNPGKKFVTYGDDFICWVEKLSPPKVLATIEQVTQLNELGWTISNTREVTIKTSKSEKNPGREFFSFYHPIMAPKGEFVGWVNDMESCRRPAPLTQIEYARLEAREGDYAPLATLRICQKPGANKGKDMLMNKDGEFICFRNYL